MGFLDVYATKQVRYQLVQQHCLGNSGLHFSPETEKPSGMRFGHPVMTAGICFMFCACGRWDADKHFERERHAIEEKLQHEKNLRLRTAGENLVLLQSSIISGVRVGMSSTELAGVAGYRFDLLARTSAGNNIWERRRYLLSHVVASRWGSFSTESKLCDKDIEMFTLTVVNGFVRDVDFVY